METDVCKADRETNVEFFNEKDAHINEGKVEEKSKERGKDHHIGSNCSSSKGRGGWLPDLMITTPQLAHSLSTSCLSANNPIPSSQEHIFSKNQEEVQYDDILERRDGAKKYDDHYYPSKKRGPYSVTASSFSSSGTSIQGPESYQNQCQIIKSLLGCDLDLIEVKDDGEIILNQFPSNNSGSAPASVCGMDGIEKGFDILVVDDSKLNRKMLCKVLRSKGHVCDEADDGLKAVQKVKERMMQCNTEKKNSFDAILMDFVMPCMDGPTGT